LKVGVVLHEGKADAVELAGRLTTWLEQHGVEPVMLPAEAAVAGRPELAGSAI